MTDTKWHIEGKWLEYCSCEHGCPCEAMAAPSNGHCDGAVAMHIDKGRFGDVLLDDVSVVATFFFPRAIHHGGGHMQPIISDHTSDAQREALFTILSGEGQPAGTIFNIFSVIIEHHHDPIFTKIGFEWDMDARRAKIDVPDVVRAETAPIRNPVTDEEHRMLTVLPDGWTFYEAEVGSGSAKGIGDIKFDYSQRHSSLARFAFNNDGMAYGYDEFRRMQA
jgi:hypothetical protein